MSSKKPTTATPSTGLADHTIDDLMAAIEQRLAGTTRYQPPIGGIPWPPVCPPWPPFCPNCGAGELGSLGGGAFTNPMQPRTQIANPAMSYSMMAAPGKSFISMDQIGVELLASLGRWKDRLKGKTLTDKVASLAANGGGRFDVVSAVNRSAVFRGLGIMLFPSHLAGDDLLEDVAETLSKLLIDAGHEVLQ